jgi:hypothetical protein
MEACYFGTDSHRLYGVVPEAADSAPTALVFCPPFAEEMVTTYARFASWGKHLEAEGIPVVRFHPFGTGESGGSFGDFTLASAVGDACSATELARHRVSPARLGKAQAKRDWKTADGKDVLNRELWEQLAARQHGRSDAIVPGHLRVGR